MAMTIKQLLDFSWMSQASYLDFSGARDFWLKLTSSQINADKIFSPNQATAFTDAANGYSFINYTPNDASGFSATVFKSNSATNDYTIAVRGTEPSFFQSLLGATADLLNADVLGVTLKGAAYEQTISAYRYYKQQTTANGRQISYSTAELAKLGAMYNETLLSLPIPILDAVVRTVRVSQFLATFTDVANPNNWGVGAIDATTANIHFTGHSLGGHVATLLASMVQQFGQGNVADVTTYNAPGQGGLFGVNPLIDATQIAAKITNIIGEGGMTVTPNVGNASGTIGQLFIEINSSNPIDNHSIVKLSDSLAAYNLFAQLEPTAGLNTITNILKAESNVAANSLESAVSALGKLFNVAGTSFTANEFNSGTAGRDLLYKAAQDITAALPAAGGLTLRDLTAFNATQLVSVAQNNLAYRYALVNGNPFALVGDDTLYAPHNANGELDLFDPATHSGNLTDQYLTDRANYLKWELQANAQDKSVLPGDKAPNDWQYTDQTIHSTLTVKGGLMASTVPARQIIFGSGGNDDGSLSISPALTGGSEADRLYGMGGNDTLQGNGGNDYLEGGQGADSYVWNSGDGLDTIRDTDGLGGIVVNGQTLGAGETKDGGRSYTSTDANNIKHTYTVLAGDINSAQGATLLIDSTIEVFNYHAGDLGLTLGNAAPVQPTQPGSTTRDIVGDFGPMDFYDANGNLVYQYDDLGNLVTDPNKAGPRADTLYDSAGNDRIASGGGNDTINLMRGGDDLVDSGSGDDTVNKTASGNATLTLGDGADRLYVNAASTGILDISGGAGRDYAEGGAGSDLIQGNMDADILAGGIGGDRMFGDSEVTVEQAILNGSTDIATGLQGDWLAGEAGDDILVSREGNDVLSGGGGNDLLIAGAGDDDILGDADWVAQRFDWTVTDQPDGTRYFYPTGGTLTPADSGNDAIYAGEGNDHAWGGTGNDVIFGEGGADKLYGEEGSDILFGGAGDDRIEGEGGSSAADTAGDDYIDGGDGNDTLIGGGGSDVIIGGLGNDQLFGDSDQTPAAAQGDDYMDGGAGDDYLRGYTGNDTLLGGDGADILQGEAGNDTLDGGAGNDNLYGKEGGDTLNGGAGDDLLIGGNGDGSSPDGDTLDGGDGNDTMYGDAGNDNLLGGLGDDRLYGGNGANYLDGGDGADILNSGGPGSELYGGAGNDDISAGGGGNYLDGEEGADTLVADGGNNTLFGGAGNDTLQASGGTNYLDGEAGDNILIASGGNNTLFAGAGTDTLSAAGGSNYLDSGDGNDTLIADTGNNTLLGGAGDDYLSATGGTNTLDGGDGADYLTANGGNNSLAGGNGADTLYAHGGNNILLGGAGDDTLLAFGGGNTLDGGDGRDWYVFDQGFGINHIADSGTGGNAIQFNFSFANSGITIGLGSLKLSFADGSELHIDNFDANNPLNTCSIDTFAFADRTLSLQEILDIGMDVAGTPNADFIQGTGMNERINALAGDDTILAGGGNDTINAGAGNDFIDGGAGADAMTGGLGDDTYVVDSTTDVIVENAGEGTDTVQSGISYTLANTLENLTLTGPSTGSGQAAFNLNATGNTLDNILTGNDGNNTLDGQAGADSMAGGAGDDTYIIDNGSDLVTENLNAGTDNIYSSVSYTLTDNVENLTLTGTAAISGTGNASNNVITGNDSINVLAGGDGNDTLYGYDGKDTLDGGSGVDVMNGGYGNDTYYVDNAGDQVIETYVGKSTTYWNGRGWTTTTVWDSDTVNANFSYTLGTNLDNLNLTGTGNINGIGNTLSNRITGNDGQNILYGYGGFDTLNGGAGSDTLYGGDGNDTLDGGLGTDVMVGESGNDIYVVDDAGDQVAENAVGLGTTTMWSSKYGYRTHVGDYDSVRSSISYTLGNYLEQLELTGTANINGVGNAQNNLIIGNAGANTLLGNAGIDILEGGAGNDTLDGGADADTLYGDTGDDTLMGGVGADTLYGGEDNDSLIGGDGNDVLYGEAGNDSLQGDVGNDVLRGELGNDAISGGDGNDTIYGDLTSVGSYSTSWLYNVMDTLDGGAGDDYIDGQMGDDVIYGGAGNDTLLGGVDGSNNDGSIDVYVSNDDMIDGGDGNDTVNGGSGADTLYGGAGNDVVTGGDGNISTSYLIGANGYEFFSNADTIDGGDGDDVLDGQAGDDIIYGGAGNDTLRGGNDGYMRDMAGNTVLDSNDDWLDGGTGLDVMEGGSGDDVYVADGTYAKVSGTYTEINDCGDPVLVNGERLQWTTDTVIENVGAGYDTVLSSASFVMSDGIERLELTFDPALATSDPQQYADLLASGQDGTGNALDNEIVGNALSNRLEGGAGDDMLDGLEGNDKLIGGAGNDWLAGGAGNDRYVFRLGDGADVIDDWQGNDTLYIGSDLTAANLESSRIGDDLILSVIGTTSTSSGQASDSVTLSNWFAQAEGVSRIEFCDGTALDKAGIDALFNAPPVANADAVTVSADAGISAIAVAGLLANDPDPNAGDTLSMVGFDAVTALGNTVALDANGNLALDIGNRYQSLGAGQTAMDSFNYTIADAAGLTSTATVDVTIAGVNDAPVAATAIAGQQTNEDAPFSFTVPAGTFTDIDNGDTLSYGATLADGTALPGWLSFDAATQTFSGIPSNWDVGNLNVLVTATDTGGLSASSVFAVAVANVNDAPTVSMALTDHAALQDAAFSFSVPTGTFDDVDFIHGDMLSYGATLADGTALPGWLSFDAATQTFSGIPTNWDVGNLNVLVTATDTGGLSASSALNLNVVNVNDAPTANADAGAATEDGGAVLMSAATLLANDTDPDFIHGDALNIVGVSQAASGAAVSLLPSTGSGQAGNVQYDVGSLFQSLAQGQTATDTFSYTVSDLAGATSTATVTMTVTGVNDAPVAAADVAYVREDLNITATGNVLANDSDVDQGAVLSVSDAGIRAGSYGSLNLAADGSYSYTLDNASMSVQSLGRDAQVAEHFGYTATDGMVGASSVLDIFLNGANDAPILVAPLADQNLAFDKHFSWQMPEGSFTDIDQGDTLTYGAALADGSALPDWLSFDAATRTFSGETPKEVGFVDVQVTATDSVAATGSTVGSLSAQDVFRISVSHGNEGVGNGEDAPPPGHDHNTNDGAGTSPGHPGSGHPDSGGGSSHPTASASHPQEQDRHERSSDAKTHKDDTSQHDTDDSGNHHTDELIRTWFEEKSASEQYSSFGALDRHGAWGGQIDRQVNRNVARGISGDVSQEWERMNARLKEHLEQSGGDEGLFAESGTGSRSFGLFGSGGSQGVAQLGMGSGQQLKSLAGLKEGLERLGG